MFKLVLTFVILCTILSTTVAAQTATQGASQNQAKSTQDIAPEKLALIKELLVVTDSKKNSAAIFNAILDHMEKSMPEIIWRAVSGMSEIKELSAAEQQLLHDDIKEDSLRRSQRMRARLADRFDFVRLTEEVSIPLYAKYFSESELRDLIAFYKSPTGKRTIETMPNLYAESMAMANERLEPVLKEVIDEISTEETTKFQEKVTTLVKPKAATQKGKGRRRKP